MSRVVLTVGPGHTLREAAQAMKERKTGAAVVIDPDQPGPGIVTERDLLDSIGSGQNTAAERLGLRSLRDAGADAGLALPGTLARRVRHVVTENDRVDAFVAALRAGDFATAGDLLDASHRSLREDFESSVPAVEETVVRAKAAGALGARMMGGGFGGNVLALFPPGTGIPQPALAVEPSPGARLL